MTQQSRTFIRKTEKLLTSVVGKERNPAKPTSYLNGVVRIRALLAFMVAIGIALAQQPAPQSVPSPTLRVTSRLVLVDAVVTDKNGNPVKGLTATDFTISENKRSQKIVAFSYEQFAAGARGAAPSSLPPNIATNRPQYTVPAGPPTVLLIDSLNTNVQDAASARIQLLKYINTQLQPGQPVAVYTLGLKLRILQDFTDDPRLLRAAVESFTPTKSLQLQIEDVASRLPPPPRIFDATGPRGTAQAAQVLENISEFYNDQVAVSLDDRVGRTLSAFRVVARAVAGMPGRKTLVWVSGSFPLVLTQVIQKFGTTAAEMGSTGENYRSVERVYEDKIREVAAFLTDAQVAVYPVDARGLLGMIVMDAGIQRTNADAEFGADLSRSSEALETSQQTLTLVAEETGGRVFKNRNDVDRAVTLSLGDSSSYYLIGYSPEDKNWDGKFRSIQVEVNKPGLKVRSRHGYYATDPSLWTKDNRNKDAEMMAQMARSNPTSTMIIFDARVVPPPSLGDKIKLLIDFLVDPRTISYADDKGGRRYELDFHAAAYGPDGKLVGHQDVGTKAGVKAENVTALEQGGFPYHMELELPPGRYFLRLGVRDERTGFIGTADLPLVLGKS